MDVVCDVAYLYTHAQQGLPQHVADVIAQTYYDILGTGRISLFGRASFTSVVLRSNRSQGHPPALHGNIAFWQLSAGSIADFSPMVGACDD